MSEPMKDTGVHWILPLGPDCTVAILSNKPLSARHIAMLRKFVDLAAEIAEEDEAVATAEPEAPR